MILEMVSLLTVAPYTSAKCAGDLPGGQTAVPRVQVKAVAAPLRRPPGPGRGQP